MTKNKRFTLLYGIDENPFEWDIIDNQKNAIISQSNGIAICNKLNELAEENKTLKTRFKEERELAMRLSRECDTLTIKKQELELEIIRLETIIRTGEKVIE